MRLRVAVAVAGLGRAGRGLRLRLLRTHEDFEVAAVVDPDPVPRAAVGEATGLPAHAAVDALDARSVDVAVVAVPSHLRAEVATALLRRGISVFPEKPVRPTTAEADAPTRGTVRPIEGFYRSARAAGRTGRASGPAAREEARTA